MLARMWERKEKESGGERNEHFAYIRPGFFSLQGLLLPNFLCSQSSLPYISFSPPPYAYSCTNHAKLDIVIRWPSTGMDSVWPLLRILNQIALQLYKRQFSLLPNVFSLSIRRWRSDIWHYSFMEGMTLSLIFWLICDIACDLQWHCDTGIYIATRPMAAHAETGMQLSHCLLLSMTCIYSGSKCASYPWMKSSHCTFSLTATTDIRLDFPTKIISICPTMPSKVR